MRNSLEAPLLANRDPHQKKGVPAILLTSRIRVNLPVSFNRSAFAQADDESGGIAENADGGGDFDEALL